MGFNKVFIPNMEKLKMDLHEMGFINFSEHWRIKLSKADVLFGGEKEINMVKQFAKKTYNVKEFNQKNKEYHVNRSY